MPQASHIDLLLQRQSNPNLTAPAPQGEDLNNILNAAMAVPDHGNIAPWRMTVLEKSGLDQLSELFVKSATLNNADEVKLTKTKKMPYRAPMIIVVSTKYQQHPKVPQVEQLVAAGCAAHAIQMAAYTLGYGGMWRTGDLAFCDIVKDGLGVDVNDDIVGFLYIGTIEKVLMDKPRKPFESVTNFIR